MMTVGSLFSGIGGFDLGLERAGMRVEWQVENNEFCRNVLKKHWPKVPCHYDITTINWRDIPRVDLICGEFPCQPFSVAGKRRGAADDRYLWPEVVRCLDALRPTWFLGENVPGLINLALDQVCTDLESLGYTVWPVCLPACAVDAPHIRQRIWIIGYADSSSAGLQGARHVTSADRCGEETGLSGCVRQNVADANNGRLSQSEFESSEAGANRTRQRSCPAGESWWPTEPNVGRVAHGVPRRVDRLKGLGNAIVPQIVEALGFMILISQQEAP